MLKLFCTLIFIRLQRGVFSPEVHVVRAKLEHQNYNEEGDFLRPRASKYVKLFFRVSF